jgi:RNA polymerase sigma factor for flagellar operon FliA
MGQEALEMELVEEVAEQVEIAKPAPDRRRRASAVGLTTPERRAKASDRRAPRARKAPGFGSRRNQKLSMGLTKAELIEKYRYKVRIIAISMARNLPSSIEVDDLISVGYMGLMDAGDRFDPKRGVKFETYAALRIRGSIMDELRNMDWIPRSARDRVNEIQSTREILRAQTGDAPSASQMSEEMEIPLKKLQELLRDLGSITLVNLDDMPEGYEPEASAEGSPFKQVVQGEIKALVTRALSELSERERMVLNFYYYRGLGVKEISEILEVTESRVSQIHTQAVSALRRQMKTAPSTIENVFLTLMED